MGGGQAIAAGGVYSAGDRDGDFFCHTVLRDEICAAGREPAAASAVQGRRRQDDLFLLDCGNILALAWFSRIVDAALGMPSVADVSRPEWDRNPVSAAGNPRVSIIVPARNEEETLSRR